MEENGSEGIFDVIQTEAAEGKFLDDVDFFCISVRTEWISHVVELYDDCGCEKYHSNEAIWSDPQHTLMFFYLSLLALYRTITGWGHTSPV